MLNNKTINVPIITRVEGEGALHIRIDAGKISELQLKIFEPPRLFEKFLQGRGCNEVLDIVARICGICPVAYQMSATQALEQCFGVTPSAWVREMRRLFYCGEWIESHSLHIHFLALPDFLGGKTAIELAKSYPEEVKRGLRLQAFGNELVSLFGGRSVHPVGACISGFYKAPDVKKTQSLLTLAHERIADCLNLIRWLATLEYPEKEQNFVSVSLQHPLEYPMNEGRIVASNGLSIENSEFEQYFQEFQVPYSTALHCKLNNQTYLVGPLARLNLNYQKLPVAIRSLLEELKIKFPSNNMFLSIIARAIEIYYAVLEAIRLLSTYQPTPTPNSNCTPRAGIGYGCTEAPRGLLWQKFVTKKDGEIENVKIVPPTSQNQARIEEDLYQTLNQFGLNQSEELLREKAEKIVRNYDPCISCSTHFLQLTIERYD